MKVISAENPFNLNEPEYKKFFSPSTPIASLNYLNGKVYLDIKKQDKYDPEYRIYKDGKLEASTFQSTWTGDASTDIKKHCYVVIAAYGKNDSPASYPICLNAHEGEISFSPSNDSLISNDHASREFKHGKFHFNDWGLPNSTLTTQKLSFKTDGKRNISVEYGNGNPISTGITAAVKRLSIKEADSDQTIHSEVIMMPHLGRWIRWDLSNSVSFNFLKDKEYIIELTDHFNMSYLEHFSIYKGHGGRTGMYNRSNISQIIISPILN